MIILTHFLLRIISLSSLPVFLLNSCSPIFSFLCSVLVTTVCLFALFILVILLYDLIQFNEILYTCIYL